MKIPIIKYSDKFLTSISILMTIGGITLWPYIVLREKYRDNSWYKKKNEKIIRHESIHIKQQGELLVIFFYLLYILEFIIRFLLCWNIYKAYSRISFEREAKEKENDPTYLKNRSLWSFVNYL